MKLAFQCAILSARGGGIPVAVLALAERLRARHQITLISPDPPEEHPPGLDIERPMQGGPLMLDATAILRRLAPDIVHTHGLWSALSLSAARYGVQTGRPLVVSPHGMLDPWALLQSKTKKRVGMALMERSHLSRASAIHVLTTAEAHDVRRLGIQTPIAVIPNGVDLPVQSGLPRPEFMHERTLLFLGRLHPKKGLAELIDAFNLAAPRLPGWRLAIAGWDDGATGYRERAAAGRADIVFVGPLFGALKAAAYAHAAAFILPSYSEGLPLTVLEAWAAGVPVLMTDACNLAEGFTVGAAARIATDATEMAHSLATLLPNDDWRQAAGAAGRALVTARFTWDRVAADFEELYQFVGAGGPRPAALF